MSTQISDDPRTDGGGPTATAAPPGRAGRSPLAALSSRIGQKGFAWALLTPVLIFFVIWNLVPLLWMAGLSFYRYDLTSANPPRFIGWENFTALASSTTLWGSFGTTFTFVVVTVSFATFFGLVLGFFFWGSTDMPGRRLALTLLFSPMLLTPLAAGTFFSLMLDPSFGVINHFVEQVTGSRVDFLSNPATAFPAVLMVDIWMWTPFMTLITLAALGSVPKAELEAAEVDRLSWLKRVRYVVLPNAKFILMLGILLRTIDAFKTTDLVFLMTRGGPGNRTELIGLRLFRTGFEAFNMGPASALALVTLFIAIGFTSIFLYILNLRKERS